MIFTKESLVDLLKNNVVTVTFTKVDGTDRTMKCTLLGEYVPAPTEGKVLLQENTAQGRVSCVPHHSHNPGCVPVY